jgi:hypothetical protein
LTQQIIKMFLAFQRIGKKHGTIQIHDFVSIGKKQ